MEAIERNRMYEEEVGKYCDGMLDELTHIRFTQKMDGYKDEEVDSFLDKVENLLNYHKLGKSKKVFIEPMAVKEYVFHVGQMGYNMEQVDAYVDRLAQMLGGINEIKNKYIGE